MITSFAIFEQLELQVIEKGARENRIRQNHDTEISTFYRELLDCFMKLSVPFP